MAIIYNQNIESEDLAFYFDGLNIKSNPMQGNKIFDLTKTNACLGGDENVALYEDGIGFLSNESLTSRLSCINNISSSLQQGSFSISVKVKPHDYYSFNNAGANYRPIASTLYDLTTPVLGNKGQTTFYANINTVDSSLTFSMFFDFENSVKRDLFLDSGAQELIYDLNDYSDQDLIVNFVFTFDTNNNFWALYKNGDLIHVWDKSYEYFEGPMLLGEIFSFGSDYLYNGSSYSFIRIIDVYVYTKILTGKEIHDNFISKNYMLRNV